VRTASASLFVLALLGTTSAACRRTKQPLRVAAASDLAGALDPIAADFEREHGVAVAITYGSSGLLARQIREGAPFDVFVAANEGYADDAVATGRCARSSKRLYARGALVTWSRDAAMVPAAITDLAQPRYARIAIANPEHAPYGRAAKEALEHAGVWSAVATRIVLADNVRQTLAFAESGSADVALVSSSLASDGRGASRLVDEALHAPIVQAAVACGERADEGAAFVELLAGARGRPHLLAHGFLPPP
jgi:molybdate transport system substrate-binding protein